MDAKSGRCLQSDLFKFTQLLCCVCVCVESLCGYKEELGGCPLGSAMTPSPYFLENRGRTFQDRYIFSVLLEAIIRDKAFRIAVIKKREKNICFAMELELGLLLLLLPFH